MTDRVEIRDLLVRTVIGIGEIERKDRQDVVINVSLDVDTRLPGETDAIEHAVNYRTIAKQILNVTKDSSYHLVERLAERLAEICLEAEGVERARVSVEKPGAVRFARSVGVVIERARLTGHRALLSLGSNTDPERHLPQAVLALRALGRPLAVSSVWESAPVDGSDQPNYLNMALALETGLTPEALVERLRDIEDALGRVRDPANAYAARTIDIDLSLYDDLDGEVAGRTLPDPDIGQRVFVALPLAELAPEATCAAWGRTLCELARDLFGDARGLSPRPDVTAAVREAARA